MNYLQNKRILVITLIILLAGIIFLLIDKNKNQMSENGEEDPTETSLSLFYYNPSLDLDSNGNVMCGEKGLAQVERKVSETENNIQGAVELLLKGEITTEERQRGITTEFPLEGLELVNVDTRNGIATLQFEDPLFKTSGGACRAGILFAQLEATVKQFEGVREVKFLPDELFQP